ncbi:MAG: flippase [Thermoflexales bacterium]|nr:flippase [Thermoflexales bacterium]
MARLRRFATTACVLALLLAPFLLFLPVTVGGLTLLPADNIFQYEPFASMASTLGVGRPQNHLLSDLVLENYAWKHFILSSLGQGELPLWNPNLFAGVPFLAAGQHSALYPLSILYYVLPLEAAYGWFTVLNLGLAGVFMFVFARTLGLGRAGALFAGLAYELSGFMLSSVVFQMIIAAAAWMPLVLAMADRIIHQAPGLRGRPATVPWAVLGAFALGCQILAGHVEVTLYTAILTVAFSSWRLIVITRRRGARAWIRPLAGLTAMALGGGLLGAIQLLPLYELVTQSFRAGRADFAQVLSYGFPKSLGWLRWLMPNFFGSEAQHQYFDVFGLRFAAVPTPSGHTWWQDGRWKNSVEGAAYVGILTLLLAAYAALQGVRRRGRWLANERGALAGAFPRWFFVVLAVACVGFIFGTPLYAILYYGLPGINQLHSPFRWIYPLTIALSLLAGAGLDAALRKPAGERLRKVGRALLIAGAMLVALIVFARLGFTALREPLARVIERLDLADDGFTPELFFSLEAVNAFGLAVWTLASGTILLALGSARRRHLGAMAAIALVVADCALAWTGFNPAVDPALLKVTPEAIGFLKQQPGQWRLTTYEPNGGKPLNANLAWWFDLQDIRGYDSIIPRQYVDYMQAIEPQGELPYNRIAPFQRAASLSSPLVDVLGVRFVLAQSRDALSVPGLKRVFDDGHVSIYENTRALPRAYTLPLAAAERVTSFANAVQTRDPRRLAVFEGGGAPTTGTPSEPGPATITSYRNNEVWIDVPAGEGRWLILTDSAFAGWRAMVRSTDAGDNTFTDLDIQRVNGNFRAVKLEASATPLTIRFRYAPDSLRIGAFASFIGLVSLLALATLYLWRARGTPDDTHAVRVIARNSLLLTGLNLVARVIDMAFAFLMLRVLGPAGAGNYSFAVVIVSWFEILMNFGLNTFLIRDAARDKANAFRYFFDTSVLRLMLGALATPLVLIVIALYASSDGISVDTQTTLLLLTLSQIPGSLATGLSALFFAHDKAEVPAGLTIVSALIKAALGAALLLGGWGIVGLAMTSIATNLITLGVLLVLARRILHLPFSLPREGPQPMSRLAILREASPLAINHLLSTIFWRLDVPLLKGFTRSETQVGYYTAGYKYIDAFNIVPSLFTQALFPTLSRMAGEREPGSPTDNPLARAYVLAVKLLWMLALPLAVVVTFAAGPLIKVLGGDAFLPQGALALSITIWHMPFGWINSVTNYALIAVGQQRRLVGAFVAAVAFNLIANIIFLPRYGFVAAAAITALSELAQLAAFYVFVRAHITRLKWHRLLGRPLIAAALMALSIYILSGVGLLGLGVVVGVLVYAVALVGLEALSPIDRRMLAPLLPARLRRTE